MKSIRKKAIIRAMKHDACKLLNEYFRVEHTRATHGVSIISEERESAICWTLEGYGEIIERNNLLEMKLKPKEREWLLETSMFL